MEHESSVLRIRARGIELERLSNIGRNPRLLLVDDDTDLQYFARRWAERHFIELLPAHSREDALAWVRAGFVDGALISSELEGAPAFALGHELRALPGAKDLPIAFISDDDGPDSRALAAQSGGVLYLIKPLTESRLDEAASQLLALRAGGRARVAIVDPDPEFRAEASRVLESAGFEVCVRDEAGDLIRLLESTEPDALLVDLATTSLGGLDVCRVIRTSAGWQDLPILVVTGAAGEMLRIRAFRAGCDDYLIKPVSSEELLTRVGARVERRRLLQARLGQDPLTGLSLRRAFVDRARARLSEARRHGQLFTLCLLDLDRFKEVNDRFGHLAGDRVLAGVGRLLSTRLRVEDLRARWGGEEFVLAFPGQDRAAASRAVDKLLAELAATRFTSDTGAPFNVTFSAGIATWPTDADGLEQLLRVADARLYGAKAAGRARIVAA